jgi:hypothetical protein
VEMIAATLSLAMTRALPFSPLVMVRAGRKFPPILAAGLPSRLGQCVTQTRRFGPCFRNHLRVRLKPSLGSHGDVLSCEVPKSQTLFFTAFLAA